MSVDWQVTKSTHICAATGCELEVGEHYYSALKEEGESFVRLDYSTDAWDEVEKEDLFSYWRTQVKSAEEQKKKLVIDVEAFYTFFASLNDPEEEHRKVFRYLVALILTRKRILRLDEIEKGTDGDTLLLYDRRAKADIRVFCPEVTDQQLEQAQENLNQIFECQIDDMDDN